ncbi:MAG TPA: response regulator [Planctomycetaceae bacterium]|nr:response regulator [Planctomycetaceae bacterium]
MAETQRRENPPAHLSGLKVLVVDDNATNRHVLEEMLRRWDMIPTTAASADEAFELFRAACDSDDPFRLVLTDASMPGTDGFDLVERIRREPCCRNPVIVMLSSVDQTDQAVLCEELGMAACLIKPIKQSDLFNAIAAALGWSAAERLEQEKQGASTEDALAGRRLKILLVEDSTVNQKVALALLKKHGHEVTVAKNGQEAVAAFQKQDFDVVLMDVQMPEMDGYQATEMIRRHEVGTGRRVPIIAMTAHALKGDRERCLAAGMDDYIAKPIRSRELFETIAAVLRRSEGRTPPPPTESESQGSPS